MDDYSAALVRDYVKHVKRKKAEEAREQERIAKKQSEKIDELQADQDLRPERKEQLKKGNVQVKTGRFVNEPDRRFTLIKPLSQQPRRQDEIIFPAYFEGDMLPPKKTEEEYVPEQSQNDGDDYLQNFFGAQAEEYGIGESKTKSQAAVPIKSAQEDEKEMELEDEYDEIPEEDLYLFIDNPLGPSDKASISAKTAVTMDDPGRSRLPTPAADNFPVITVTAPLPPPTPMYGEDSGRI